MKQLRKQLNSIPKGTENGAARQEIEANIRRLEVVTNSGTGNAKQIDPATPPRRALGTQAWQKAIAAALAAILGGVLVAYLLYRLDPKVKTVGEATKVYRRPVMTTVFHDEDIDHFEDGQPATSKTSKEAFRQMKTSLDLSALDDRYHTILITSAGPGEGKSTITRNLALAMHEAGRRVALVDADLRKPSLPGMGVEPKRGITTYLAGEHDLEGAITTISLKPADMSFAANGNQPAESIALVASGATRPTRRPCSNRRPSPSSSTPFARPTTWS